MGLITCKACGHQIATNATTCPNCGAQRAPKTLKIIGLVIVGVAVVMVAAAVAAVISFSEGDTKQEATAPPVANDNDLVAPTKTILPNLEIINKEEALPSWVKYDVRPELVDGIWPPSKELLKAAAVKLLDSKKSNDGEYESGTVRFFYPGRDMPLAAYETEKGKAIFHDYNALLSYPDKYAILITGDGCDQNSESFQNAKQAAKTGDPFVFVETGGPSAIYAGCPRIAIEFFTKAIDSRMLKTKTVEREYGLDFSAPGEKKKTRPKKKVTINYLALAYGERGRALCMLAAQEHSKKTLRAGAFDLKKGIELAGPGENAHVKIWEKMMDGISTLAPEVLN